MAVFKPRDEEFAADIGTGGIDAVNEGGEMEKFELGRPNPNYPGLRIGEGALRERAAFVLDRNYGGFSGVPTTTLTRIKVRACLTGCISHKQVLVDRELALIFLGLGNSVSCRRGTAYFELKDTVAVTTKPKSSLVAQNLRLRQGLTLLQRQLRHHSSRRQS